jgi:hypothetical protein
MKTTADEADLKELWEKVLVGKKIKDEKVFLRNPKFAYLYAKYIRKKRWEEQDELIFHTDLRCACLYCVFIDGKVPDHLHNFFLAKKLGKIDDVDERWLEQYFDWNSKQNKNKQNKNK